jgi:hypothetical protein
MTVSRRTRRRRRGYVVAAILSALAVGYGVGAAIAADPRLDEADAALQKAEALLEASQTGGAPKQVQHRFDKAVARAIADVQDARQQIVEAKDAVDNP